MLALGTVRYAVPVAVGIGFALGVGFGAETAAPSRDESGEGEAEVDVDVGPEELLATSLLVSTDAFTASAAAPSSATAQLTAAID